MASFTPVPLPAGFQLVKELVYTHRKPRLIEEDDVMTCSCRHARTVVRHAGSTAQLPICCDETCENFSVRSECLIGFCSKGRCKNQRLQRAQFPSVAVIDAGPKGHGLVVSAQPRRHSRRLLRGVARSPPRAVGAPWPRILRCTVTQLSPRPQIGRAHV